MKVKWKVLEIQDPQTEDPWVIVEMSIDHGDGWRIVVERMSLEVGEYQMIGAGLGLGLHGMDRANLQMIHEDEVFLAWTRRNG